MKKARFSSEFADPSYIHCDRDRSEGVDQRWDQAGLPGRLREGHEPFPRYCENRGAGGLLRALNTLTGHREICTFGRYRSGPRDNSIQRCIAQLAHFAPLRLQRLSARPIAQLFRAPPSAILRMPDLAPKLVGSVLIRKLNPDTFEDDVQQMLRSRLTFEEAIVSEDFSPVSKQRLQIVGRELFEQMDELAL